MIRRRTRRSSLVVAVVAVVVSSPRGGQSGSGASQRLEQCSDATFWSGTRMCPLSSMWGTSSIEQYAVSTPSWYSPPNSASSTCSPLYLLV